MKLKVGLIQMHVVNSKDENINKAQQMISRAAEKGAKLVILPEMFNCPYSTKNFPIYAEKEGEYTWRFLSKIAKENKIFLVGGSIPEKTCENKVYNTCYIFDDNGNQIGKHRKVHLFDIDVKGGQYFKESETLSPGDDITVFDTPYGKMGVIICYDLRFPELSRLIALKEAKILIVPGAFNMTTGPCHWELLFRARALDNQMFAIGAAPARKSDNEYVSYGNSIITTPWGNVLNKLDEKENILVQDIELDMVDKIRQELPLLKHRRTDLY